MQNGKGRGGRDELYAPNGSEAMQLVNRLRDILAGVAVVGLLAGCSGAAGSEVTASDSPTLGQPQSARQLQSSTISRSTGRAFADPHAASTGSVIISSLAGEVDVYTDTLKLAERITGIERPTGLALDASGNLYVANLGNGHSSPGILVYKNDYKTQIATLADPFLSEGVAVDVTTGLVAVMNVLETNPVGSVTFFTKGGTTPCTTVTDANFRVVFQGAFDKDGNLYVTAQSPDGVHTLAGVIRGGCSAKKITLLSTANTFSSFIFGIQVTRFGKIAIEDQSAHAIYTYNPPVNGALGTPIATTALTGASGPEQFAFTRKGAFLFVANQSPGKAFKYAYPAGGSPLQSFASKTSEAVGLVVTPASQ